MKGGTAMKKNFLFAALSLVSNYSKYQDDNTNMKGMEIEKNSEFIISGTYSNVNNFWGLNVTGTGTEDYFYTFDMDNYGKVVRNGEEVDFESIKAGDTLRVTYDGSVSLVYPPKLNNVTKIEIMDDDTPQEKK
jgi:uncharacterized protein YkuJ